MLLHVVNDEVWFDRDGEAVCSGVMPEHFLDSLYSFGMTRQHMESYRMLLNAGNAGLITRLAGALLPGQVGYARMPEGAVTDGASALFHLRNLPADDQRPLRWQSIASPSGATYNTALIMHELHAHGHVTRLAEEALREHPSWTALSFLPELDVLSACRVVAAIGDPRWYYDARTDRFSRVYRHLGINTANLRAFTTGDEPSFNYRNFSALFTSWRPSVVGDLGDPRNFLQRIYRAQPSAVRAALAACRRLVLFIMTVWEDAVTLHPEVRFMPERFFKSDAELAAWRRHLELQQAGSPQGAA